MKEVLRARTEPDDVQLGVVAAALPGRDVDVGADEVAVEVQPLGHELFEVVHGYRGEPAISASCSRSSASLFSS